MTRRRRIRYSICSWAPTSPHANHSSKATPKKQHWISSAMKQEPSRKQDMVPRREVLKFGGRAGVALAAAGALGWGIETALERNFVRNLDDFDRYLYERKKRLQLNKLSTLSPEKKESLIDAEVSRVREFVLGPEGRRILESGSTDELWMLITMLPPILREHIAGTKYDVSPKAWPSVVIPRSSTAALNVLELSQVKKVNPKSYGNGFYVDSKTL